MLVKTALLMLRGLGFSDIPRAARQGQPGAFIDGTEKQNLTHNERKTDLMAPPNTLVILQT